MKGWRSDNPGLVWEKTTVGLPTGDKKKILTRLGRTFSKTWGWINETLSGRVNNVLGEITGSN